MDPRDVESTKILRREFNKRHMDISMADLRVSHGVAYVRGVIRPLEGDHDQLKHEVEHLIHLLKGMHEFRDVVFEATLAR